MVTKHERSPLAYLKTPYQFGDFKNSEIEEFTLKAYFAGCIEEATDFDICIISPAGQFKKYRNEIIVFPFSFYYLDRNDQPKIGFIDKSVLYKGKLYSQNKFFKSGKMLNRELLLYRLNRARPLSMVRVSLSLLFASPEEYREIAKKLTRIRKQVMNWSYEPIKNYRGKFKEEKPESKELREFVIKKYKALGKPKRIPVGIITDAWTEYYGQKYSEDQAFVPPDNVRIWRIIKSYTKKYIS